MNEFLEARAVAGPWHSDIEILIKQKTSAGIATCDELIMTTKKEGEGIDPSFKLEKHKAQILMDDLWHAGLRPTEGTGSAGSLAATQRHLEDMRTLVFKGNSNPSTKVVK